MKNLRIVFLFALLLPLLASLLLQVARCQSDSDVETVGASEDVSDLGIVGEDMQDNVDGKFGPAPGVETVCIFPKNSARLVPAGKETELLVGVLNSGESTVNVIGIKASLHLPRDHNYQIQNLTGQGFNNATLPASAQATFPYIFAISEYLQPGVLDLVGTIIYEIDQHPYQSTFYNGTIDVVEPDGFPSMETVFLVALGGGFLFFLGLWFPSQIKTLSKKKKEAPKVEMGTAARDASMDEWLEGTAYSQSMNGKLKKKKKTAA